MLVWNTTGEQGDKWNFGQVGYKGDLKSYKVRVSLQQVTFNTSSKSHCP